MRSVSAATLFVLCLAAEQATATGWLDAAAYSSPSNINNICNDKQRGGFDWNGLSLGSFSTYGDFDFSGFSCSTSFGKRHLKSPRKKEFQKKCITGSISTTAANNLKISSKNSFSITDVQVSVSFDTNVDFIYSMEDGSTCKQTAPCLASGSTIKNSQCGGAKSITFQIPDTSKNSSSLIGIHSIGFDCAKASSTVSPISVATPIPTPISSIPAVTTAATTPFVRFGNLSSTITQSGPISTGGIAMTTSIVYVTSEITKTQCATTVTDCPVRSTVVVVSTISSYTTVCPVTQTPASSVPLPASSAPSSVAASTSPTLVSVTSAPTLSSSTIAGQSSVSQSSNNAANSASAPVSSSLAPGSTQAVVTTQIIYDTTTICPVTNTVTSGTQQIVQTSLGVSTIKVTSISTVCTHCVAPPPVTSNVVPSTVTSVAAPPPVSSSVAAPSSVGSLTTPNASASSTAAAPPPPSAPASGTTQAVVTTVIVYATTTFCPITNTIASGTTQIVQTTQSPSTFFVTSTSTICTRCVAPTSAPAAPITSAVSASSTNAPLSATIVSAPAPSAPCPNVLPKCLNTWIFTTGCNDNSDYQCYCKQSNFTESVIGCVTSRGSDSKEISAALSYLAGICAPYVSQNPGIITAVPSSISLGFTPPTPSTIIASSAPASSSNNGAIPTSGSSSATPVTVSSAVSTPTLVASSVSSMTADSSIITPGPSSPASAATSSNNGAVPDTSVTTTTVALAAPAPTMPVTVIVVPGTTAIPVTLTVKNTVIRSSTVITVQSSITVPQVQFTVVASASSGAAPSIGLAPGTPAANPNTTPTSTPGAIRSGKSSYFPAGSTGTLAPMASSIAVPSSRTPSSPSITTFKGAASGMSARESIIALTLGCLIALIVQL